MATELKPFVSFFGILIFVVCVSFVAEARLLRSTIMQKLQSPAGDVIIGDDSWNWLSFRAVKVGQSTPGGVVHKYTINAKTLDEINNSGPSPRGDGHKLDKMNDSESSFRGNEDNLNEINNFGPSPRGNRHKLDEMNDFGSSSLDNGYNLDEMNDSGPSPRRNGHEYFDAKLLGEIKDSGPSPGNNNDYTNTKTLGGIKDAGPSLGNNNVYTNFKTLKEIKDSGPTPGNGHHKYTNVETLG